MTYCDHGIPHETGCDECDEAELITWAEELQREPECSQSYRARMWRRMLLGLAVFWGGALFLIWRMI